MSVAEKFRERTEDFRIALTEETNQIRAEGLSYLPRRVADTGLPFLCTSLVVMVAGGTVGLITRNETIINGSLVVFLLSPLEIPLRGGAEAIRDVSGKIQDILTAS